MLINANKDDDKVDEDADDEEWRRRCPINIITSISKTKRLKYTRTYTRLRQLIIYTIIALYNYIIPPLY
mgnify:CR=1 FL=1